MTLKHKKITGKKEKIFKLFLPLILLTAVSLVIVSIFAFKNSRQEELKPIITDGKFNKEEVIAYFHGQKITPPDKEWFLSLQETKVLSAETDDNKWIEIDLTNQKLKAWEGDNMVYEFPVSTGKKQWGTATPPGVYRIWIKLKSTLMHGGSGDHYYYLPNVQCTQYFYNGFGIHGTYWHNNFGHPMSHGCVNMRNEDACTLFYWTSPPINESQTMIRPSADSPGTKVVVHGETPWE